MRRYHWYPCQSVLLLRASRLPHFIQMLPYSPHLRSMFATWLEFDLTRHRINFRTVLIWYLSVESKNQQMPFFFDSGYLILRFNIYNVIVFNSSKVLVVVVSKMLRLASKTGTSHSKHKKNAVQLLISQETICLCLYLSIHF